MRHRHAISDADWERIKDLLPGRPGQPGWVARDNRLFLDAILWIAKTGAPWRDLPERFGKWNSVWKRFDRWAKKGTWQRIFEALQDPDLEWLILDSTIIRAHPHAAGAKKSGWGRGTKRAGTGSESRRVRDQDSCRSQWAGAAREAHPDSRAGGRHQPRGEADRGGADRGRDRRQGLRQQEVGPGDPSAGRGGSDSLAVQSQAAACV